MNETINTSGTSNDRPASPVNPTITASGVRAADGQRNADGSRNFDDKSVDTNYDNRNPNDPNRPLNERDHRLADDRGHAYNDLIGTTTGEKTIEGSVFVFMQGLSARLTTAIESKDPLRAVRAEIDNINNNKGRISQAVSASVHVPYDAAHPVPAPQPAFRSSPVNHPRDLSLSE